MAKKIGTLIKEARIGAGLTQAELGRRVGLSASDIGKAERGEKTLTQEDLKLIAKATGVTQTSLLSAAKTTGKTGSSARTGKSGTSSSSGTQVKLTATEKKLVELYRAADADTKKAAVNLLKGQKSDILEGLLGSFLGGKKTENGDLLGSLLGGKKTENGELVNTLLEMLNKK